VLLLMQQPRYRPILPGPAEGQTSASLDESFNFAGKACRLIGLTQLRYHYTPIHRNSDKSMSMRFKPMGLTQMSYLPHDFFDQPPRRSSNMDDSETQAKDDENDDDDNDIQDPESNDPSRQVVEERGQAIGMYAN
jgi:hypothetical protein